MAVLTIEPGRTLVMGVVNATPDSFSGGGRFLEPEKALRQALRLIADGADVLDVGGESTRPGSEPVSAAEELDRVAGLVERLSGETEVPVSIDTCKPAVAAECVRLGARIVNDVTGLRDPAMARVVAEGGAAVVIMHMLGEPKTMQHDPAYADVVAEVKDHLATQAKTASAAGIAEVYVDPGIGFGKTAAHNFRLLERLSEFQGIGQGVLVGPSRKAFLGSLPSRLPIEERLEGTVAACCWAAMHGAAMVRVHDVKPVKRALEVIEAIGGSGARRG